MKRILAVENSPELLTLFETIFKTDNITVDCCANAASMFASLKTLTPDMMLIDVMRSGLDEKVICGDLRQRKSLQKAPILITSTKKEHVNNFRFFGADDAIEKPFELSEFKNKSDLFFPLLIDATGRQDFISGCIMLFSKIFFV